MATKILKLHNKEVLQKEGEVPLSVFIVKTGVITFLSEKNQSPFLPKDISVGQIINGLSLFKRFLNTATAQVSSESAELIEIPFADLIQSIEGMNQTAKAVIHSIVNQVLDLDHDRKAFFSQLQKLRSGELDVDRLFLKMNEALLVALELYGMEHAEGVQVAFDHIKMTATFVNEVSGIKMMEYLKALQEAMILEIHSVGPQSSNIVVRDRETLKEVSKYILRYLSSNRSKMLQVDRDEPCFLEALKLCAKDLEPNPRGIVTLDLALALETARKSINQVSRQTLEKIRLKGLDIEQVPLADRIEIKFHKEDVLETVSVWRVISCVKSSGALLSSG